MTSALVVTPQVWYFLLIQCDLIPKVKRSFRVLLTAHQLPHLRNYKEASATLTATLGPWPKRHPPWAPWTSRLQAGLPSDVLLSWLVLQRRNQHYLESPAPRCTSAQMHNLLPVGAILAGAPSCRPSPPTEVPTGSGRLVLSHPPRDWSLGPELRVQAWPLLLSSLPLPVQHQVEPLVVQPLLLLLLELRHLEIRYLQLQRQWPQHPLLRHPLLPLLVLHLLVLHLLELLLLVVRSFHSLQSSLTLANRLSSLWTVERGRCRADRGTGEGKSWVGNDIFFNIAVNNIHEFIHHLTWGRLGGELGDIFSSAHLNQSYSRDFY